MLHKTTVRLINQMGKDHDSTVLDWQSELLSVLIAEVRCIYHFFYHLVYLDFFKGGKVSKCGSCSCSR